MSRLALALLFALAPAFATAAEMPASGEQTIPGLKVGQKAPDFTLRNPAGETVMLRDLTRKGRVALAFVRSADWCPYCRRQLQDLEKSRKDIEAAGVQLVAVSYDSPETNAGAITKLGLTFPLLSDVGSKAIDAFGIRNETAKGRAAGVPHPVLFIIDQQGIIRAKLARENYRERPESAEIIAAAKAL